MNKKKRVKSTELTQELCTKNTICKQPQSIKTGDEKSNQSFNATKENLE